MSFFYFVGFELTGDSQISGFVQQLSTVDLIITTPEKWDVITRRWMDYRNFINHIGLFLIDEVHMLNETRGSTLEVVASRMRTLSKGQTRYIAVSATIPNSIDICEWLRMADGRPAVNLCFGEEYRSVPLHRIVLGNPVNSRNPFLFDMSLNYRLPDIINQYSDGKPVLIVTYAQVD